MNESRILDDVMVSTPCPMDWDRMRGDDRVRYCTACGKHVHDFAKMTAAEAALPLSMIRSWGLAGCFSAGGELSSRDYEGSI